MLVYFVFFLLSFFLLMFYLFFDKKLLCLLCLEVCMLFCIFFHFMFKYDFSGSFLVVLFLSVMMVLDSVLGITILIGSSRNTSGLSYYYKSL